MNITVRAVEAGQLVQVRGIVRAARAHSALVDMPTVKFGNIPIEVPMPDLFLPPNTDAAYDAMRLLLERLAAAQEIGARTLAELYELGGHAKRKLAVESH